MASNVGTTKVDINDVVKELTVTVEAVGLTKAVVRLTLGCWVIRFGAWIAGVKVTGIE